MPPRLDPKTGVLELDEPVASIGPTLRRSAFLRAAWARDASALVDDPPWRSWILPACRAQLAFAVSLYFHGQELRRATLCHVLPGESASWDDWSEENEKRRKVIHDRWLKETLGARRRFDWGSVSSTIDSKTGGSAICIEFSRS